MNWVVTLVGTAGGIGGIAALVQALFGRPKMRADAAAVITAAAGDFVEDARAQRAADRSEWASERQKLASRIVEVEGELARERAERREDRARIRELEEEQPILRRRVRELERANEEKDATISYLRGNNGTRLG